MKTHKYYIIVIIVIFALVGGCKKDESVQSINKINSDMKALLNDANIFTPNIEPKQKKQAIQKLIKIKDAIQAKSNNKSIEDFGNESVAMARWLLETTLNNEFANLYDSSLNEFNKDTLHYQFQISGFNTAGEPLLSGSDITSAYVSLSEKVMAINSNPDSTFYLSFIQLESLDNQSTSFQVVLSIAKKSSNSTGFLKSQPHYPWVLSPYQTPVPFGPNESYSPMPFRDHPDWTWAGREIDKKLNARKTSLPFASSADYIIESVMPCPMGGYDIPWDNTFWWSYYSLAYLNYTQLNLYLTNYKGILDSYNTPYGENNIYVSEYITTSINTYYDWPYPASIEGFGPYDAHYFHGFVMWRIIFIYVGPGS